MNNIIIYTEQHLQLAPNNTAKTNKEGNNLVDPKNIVTNLISSNNKVVSNNIKIKNSLRRALNNSSSINIDNLIKNYYKVTAKDDNAK